MIRSFITHFNSFVMALLFAIVVWAVATADQNPSHEGIYPYPLRIEVVNLPQDLVVFQKNSDTVRVRVRGPQASWDQLQPSSFSVTADLRSLTAGAYQVPIQVQVSDPRVSVTSVEPSGVGIRLEPEVVRDLDLHAEVLDSAPLGYAYRPPTATPSKVRITGPAVLVDQVVEAAADVYLRGAKANVERDVTVQPRDVRGNLVQGVVITPTTVLVRVPVEQRVGYKDVSIRAVLTGSVAPGYWISNILVNPSTVTLAGNPDLMAKLPALIETVPVDVNSATSDVTKRTTLSLPEGVSVQSSDGVFVQVSVTPIMGGQTVRRGLTLLGLRPGLSASISPDTVEVILSGPLPVLQSLSAQDVQVVLDVGVQLTGTYQLKPRVPVLPESLRVQSIVPDTVQVIVSELPPTLTPTPPGPRLGVGSVTTTTIPATSTVSSSVTTITPTSTPPR